MGQAMGMRMKKGDKERAEPTPETCGEESPAAAWAVGSDR